MVGAAPRLRGRAPGTAIGAQWPGPASIARHRRLGSAAMTMSCCSAGGDPAWGTRIEVMRDRAKVVGLHGSSGFALAATGGRAKAARPAAFFIALRASLAAMAATKAAAVGCVRRYRLTTRGRGEGWPNRSQGAPGNRAHLPRSAGQSGPPPGTRRPHLPPLPGGLTPSRIASTVVTNR